MAKSMNLLVELFMLIICDCFGPVLIFICGPVLTKTLAIWSHWLSSSHLHEAEPLQFYLLFKAKAKVEAGITESSETVITLPHTPI